MTNEMVRDELWEIVEPLKPKGGRPRVDDR